MDFLSKLGIDWKILSAQIVQFVLLIFILRKLAYKPLLAMLEKRSKIIEKSLEDAKKIEQSLAESQAERERLLQESRRASAVIVAEARTNTERLHAQAVEATKQKIQELQSRAVTDARALKQQVLQEARDELAAFVVEASKRAVAEKLTEPVDRKLAERALTEIRQ